MTQPALGLMFVRENQPETLPAWARMAEGAGLDDLWIVEDAFFNGGISAASVALAVTERITVGIGILPAPVRNVAYAAMEIATLARIFPGRLEVGLGHGVADWIRQVGAFPGSQMAALSEVIAAMRALLQGERVTMTGRHVNLDKVELDHKPDQAPRVSLGVTGPKSMVLAGRIADGTIMAEYTGPAVLLHNLVLIREGAEATGRAGEPHQVTVFAHWSQDPDGDAARDRIRPLLADRIIENGLRDLEIPGFADQARQLAASGPEDLATRMPREWIDEFSVSGTPAECAAAIARLGESGANRVCLVPPRGVPLADVQQWSEALRAANPT